MSSSQILTQIAATLEAMHRKSSNSAASATANNKDGVYVNSSTRRKFIDDDPSDGLEKLAKAAERAAKKLDKGMDDAAVVVDKETKRAVKKTKNEVKSSLWMFGKRGILFNSINQLGSDLHKTSATMKGAILGEISRITSISGTNTDKILIEGAKQFKQFKAFNNVIGSMVSKAKITSADVKEMKAVYAALGDNAKDLTNNLGNADATVKEVLKNFITGDRKRGKIQDKDLHSFKKFADSFDEGTRKFEGSVKRVVENIDTSVNAPLKKFEKSVEGLGSRLSKGLLAGGGVRQYGINGNTGRV